MLPGETLTFTDNIVYEDKQYWENKLEGLSAYAVLPSDSDSQLTPEYETTITSLGSVLTAGLLKAAANSQEQLFVLLLAGIQLLLKKYTDQSELLLGTPIFKQDDPEGLINYCLLLRNEVNDKDTFRELASRTKRIVIEAGQHQNYPYRQLLETKGFPQIVDTVVLFTGLQDETYLENVPYHLLFSFSLKDNILELKVCYNKHRFLQESVAGFMAVFMESMQAALDQPGGPVTGLVSMTATESRRLIYDLNNWVQALPENRLWARLQQHAGSDSIALVTDDQKWNYTGIYRRANRLAQYLDHQGIGPGSVVAIILPPSSDLIVSILAVLQVGACFLPIDPAIPGKRKAFMLSDSRTAVILSNASLAANNEMTNVEAALLADVTALYEYGEDVVKEYTEAAEDAPAYIIYTSGSTGYPKGVVVSRHNINNYLSWAADQYISGQRLIFPLFTSISFDLTITSIFLPLLTGGSLLIYVQEEHEVVLSRIIKENKVDIIKLTPSHLSIIKAHGYWPARLKCVIVGGEFFDRGLAREIDELSGGNVAIYNEYGPTEATVGCAIYRYDPTVTKGRSVLIGRPAPNCRLYILDKQLQPVPVGVAGEIYIGGSQVATGYISSEEKTREKFIADPFIAGARMYRTGDNARMYADGNMEYLGRIDEQVKISGYRIEPGEIEAQLTQYPGIMQARIIVDKTHPGAGILRAYYTGDNTISEVAFRNFLSMVLPAYMIPASFTWLDRFPLTRNGKLDYNALPSVDYRQSEAPGIAVSEKEKIITTAMSEVLGMGIIGVNENFFRKGGDSIKTIQLSAKLSKAGFKVSVKDIYYHPVPADLALLLQPVERYAGQGRIEGEATLNAVQHWFFANYTVQHHYNQSLLLHIRDGVDEQALEAVFDGILTHHDALRMVVKYKSGQPFLYQPAFISNAIPGRSDLRGTAHAVQQMEKQAMDLQTGFSLTDGPLIKMHLFKMDDGDRLLIVVHHLLIDGISWRILLEDLEGGYMQAIKGERISFPPKTSAFLVWNNALPGYATGNNMEKELQYWRQLDFSKLLTIEPDVMLSPEPLNKCLSDFSLSSLNTRQLLTTVNEVYNTEINDLLLSALAISLGQLFGSGHFAIAMEGHGRENILPDINISRTIGWFTSIYPIILNTQNVGNVGSMIREVKEQLRRIPTKGAGYGLLKYMRSKDNNHAVFQLRPQISFNYLGGFDDVVQNGPFEPAMENKGDNSSIANPMIHDIEIQGICIQGRLSFTITCNGSRFSRQTTENIALSYKQALLDVIRHCMEKTTPERTISDFTYKKLTDEQLSLLSAKFAFRDIYPLTPMQKALFFHALSNPGSFAYNTQFSFLIEGNFQPAILQKCFSLILKRYENLRANFTINGLSVPLQLIGEEKKMAFEEKDISGITDTATYIADFKTAMIKKPYDFEQELLMRVFVLKTGPAQYEVIWYYHHLLLDGWCLNILFREVLVIYYLLITKQSPELPAPPSYRNYMLWMQEKDFSESTAYWRNYIKGYTASGALLKKKLPTTTAGNHSDRSVTSRFDGAVVAQLMNIAKEEHCTLYTLIQVAWSLLVSRWRNQNDVMFGQVVSGRPDIAGVGDMVGLFINTIPKRVIINESLTLSAFINQVLKDDMTSLEHHTFPLGDIRSAGNALFDHVIVFENQYQLMEIQAEMAALDFKITRAESYDPNEYDLSAFISLKNEELVVEIRYNESVYLTKDIEDLQHDLRRIITLLIADTNCRVAGVFIALAAEALVLPDISIT
ncbi:amino acid adenylation domain-containing protein [Chitinophaga polysaccharea]|uniref:non-ribosomal peptide synthetase n=1 Tax=Chitinophaga polysaccharea TaxID=1293035 RepID=UPI0014552020|nr:non-ribosomal peptide synthetase [Chitinophaga polysaccharea]NLR57676.1 amino acid adenylation domain-containing protein [Chitinophaga polysaccharea]